MKEILIRALLMCICQLIGRSDATFQRWLPDTNFENPANWNAGRAPCGNDVVVIPDESPVIYVQYNTTLQELVLPKTGEVILGQNVNIGFTQTADRTKCPSADGDVEFTATHPKSWLNPSSWCSTPTAQGSSCDTATPRLDVERVPCSYDDAVMARYHSYYIDLSEPVPELTIKSLRMGRASFTTSSFATYRTSEDGRRMFKVSSSSPSSNSSTGTRITITRKPCDDKKGCACGNDQPQISKTICRHVEKTCGRPRCQKTIQPVGACCRMCGAVFNITRGYGYDFESFKNLIKQDFFTEELQKAVNMTVFVTSQGWIQLTLNDVTGDKSAALAGKMKAGMEEDLANGGHRYAINGVQLMLSMGKPIGPSAHSSNPLSGGSVAGVVIAVLIILVLLVLLTVYFVVFKRNGRELPKMPTLSMPSISMPSMPSLPRLPRRMPRATARVPAQPHTASHIDPGFANPLYDSSPFDDGNAVVKEMELMSSVLNEEQPTFGISAGGGFNNPLYGAQAMYDDPTQIDSASSPRAKKEDSTSAVATGSAHQTADTPTADTSAKMILVDINEENGSSTI